MRETEDGFRIAEEDLRLRGAGELLGTRQSGLPQFRLADLAVHGDLLAAARDDADKGLGFTQLTQRMNLYDHKERRTELINDCMETKGYVQR